MRIHRSRSPVRVALQRMVDSGFCTMAEIDSSEIVKQKLTLLSERDAVLAIDDLRRNERKKIRNFARYFVGILDRYLRERPTRDRSKRNRSRSNSHSPRSRDRIKRYRFRSSSRSRSRSHSQLCTQTGATQEQARDSLLQCERLREIAQPEEDAMVLREQEQALIQNRVIDVLHVRLLEQEQDSKVRSQALEKELRELKVENSRLREDTSNAQARVQSQALLEKEAMAYVTIIEEQSDSSSLTRSDMRQEEVLQDSNSATNLTTEPCKDNHWVTTTPSHLYHKERSAVPLRRMLNNVEVPDPIYEKYTDYEPRCAIEYLCCNSAEWIRDVVVPIYIQQGMIILPQPSTLSIDLYLANLEKGITTRLTIFLLQFPAEDGRDRDEKGQLKNFTLKTVVNHFGKTLRSSALNLMTSGLVEHHTTTDPSKAMVFLDAVQEVHTSNWANKAPEETLQNWDKILPVITKGIIDLISKKENKLEAPGELLLFPLYYYLSLQY